MKPDFTKLAVDGKTWEPTPEQVEAIVAAYAAGQWV